MSGQVNLPLTRKDKKRRLPHRNVVKLVRALDGQKFVRWANRISKLYKRGVKFSHDPASGRYQASDAFGSHFFAYPARLWSVWDGLAYRGKQIGHEYLLDAISFKEGDTIVDVGANTGDLSLYFKVLGIKPTLICFEPAPKEFSTLSANLARADHVLSYQTHQLALWSEANEGLTFYLDGNNGDNSLLAFNKPVETVTVPAARLDEVLERRSYKLLKLEAEGAEPEILSGASGVLDCFEFITVDVGFERGVTAESTLPQVVNILLAHGFETIGYNGARHTLLFRSVTRKDYK